MTTNTSTTDELDDILVNIVRGTVKLTNPKIIIADDYTASYLDEAKQALLALITKRVVEELESLDFDELADPHRYLAQLEVKAHIKVALKSVNTKEEE